ncbi:MAG: hypothetical protein HFI72_06875 [Peptococcaceae bacterium]|jgi:hypothetical protein|nr:hypothetical protein [Peptococcaceae bacterium]
MWIVLVVIFLVAVKKQLYPLVKQSYKKEVVVYIVCYLLGAVLLVMVANDTNSISLFNLSMNK